MASFFFLISFSEHFGLAGVIFFFSQHSVCLLGLASFSVALSILIIICAPLKLEHSRISLLVSTAMLKACNVKLDRTLLSGGMH